MEAVAFSAIADILANLVLPVAIVAFLAAAAEAIVEGLVSPIFKRYNLDGFWLFYVAWAVSLGLVLLSGVNLFIDFIPADTPALAWVGRVLTGVIAGRGSNFVHDFFSAKRKVADSHNEEAEVRARFYDKLLDANWRETHIAKE